MPIKLISSCRKRSDSNQGLVAFLNELRPQSLESFRTFRSQSLSPEIFPALSCHGESLIDLRLNVLPGGNFPHVSLLKGCTNLVSLLLVGNRDYGTDLKFSQNDTLLETVAWLKDCKKLRVLALDLQSRGASIAPILLEKNIYLTSLRYQFSGMRGVDQLHEALANQTSLQKLSLMGYMGDSRRKLDVLVEFLGKLVNLTFLHMEKLSDFFLDRHIVQLARSLPKLETWFTTGHVLTDAIWSEVATLRSLQRLQFVARTSFTADGILDFIEKLGPGNEGLVLSMTNTEMDKTHGFWDEHQLIQEMFARKVNGSFHFRQS